MTFLQAYDPEFAVLKTLDSCVNHYPFSLSAFVQRLRVIIDDLEAVEREHGPIVLS
jgi:hypothetical protein